MVRRHIEYNDTLACIAEQEQLGDLLGIRPNEALNIGGAEKDPKELKRVYQLGRDATTHRGGASSSFWLKNHNKIILKLRKRGICRKADPP